VQRRLDADRPIPFVPFVTPKWTFGASNECCPLRPPRPVPHRASSLSRDLGLLQVERVEALGEPTIDGGEKIVGLPRPALIAPEPGHARRRTELPGLRLLLTGNGERMLEIDFGFCLILLGRR
jgi:hypothetical protein